MANLAKEATTLRRVLESLFRYFDSCNQWSPQHGLALPIMMDMLSLMEKYGRGSYLLFCVSIKSLHGYFPPIFVMCLIACCSSNNDRISGEHTVTSLL